jgi:hypothetical protein
MSYKRRSDYKPPRARSEVRVAVLSSLAILVATGSLVWFFRPNRESTAPTPSQPTPTVVTTAPASSSTPAAATTPASSTP